MNLLQITGKEEHPAFINNSDESINKFLAFFETSNKGW